MIDAAKGYAKYSYLRKSSEAQAIHQGALNKIPQIMKAEEEKDADARKITEHNRWNAYMRSIGYEYHSKRNDLAKLHNDLVTFDELSLSERKKDIVDYKLQGMRY